MIYMLYRLLLWFFYVWCFNRTLPIYNCLILCKVEYLSNLNENIFKIVGLKIFNTTALTEVWKKMIRASTNVFENLCGWLKFRSKYCITSVEKMCAILVCWNADKNMQDGAVKLCFMRSTRLTYFIVNEYIAWEN